MHEMFSYVLNKKDLSKAGDLFQVADAVILHDLTDIINKIIDVTSQPNYAQNPNDQSVVEICITRITSAVRENGSVELHGLALVSLLQTCLNHNLRPVSPDAAPPHAKIAADIVSCIFLHYQQPSVMTVALPVAVKLLHKGNSELSRSISSYLSLAAIHSAPLLAQYTHTIVDSVIAGNYPLARILPGLYSEAQDPLHRHVMTLVSLLPRCHNPADCQPLLQLFALVSQHRPALLENSLPQLLECLGQAETLLPTLHVVLLLAKWRNDLLAPYMQRVMEAGESRVEALTIALQVACVLGRVSGDAARVALDYTAKHLPRVEKSGLAEVLREVGILVSKRPSCVSDDLLGAIRDCETVTARNTVLHILDSRTSSSSSIQHSNSGGVTVVNVNNTTSSSNSNVYYTASSALDHLMSGRADAAAAGHFRDMNGRVGSRDHVTGREYSLSTSRDLQNINSGNGYGGDGARYTSREFRDFLLGKEGGIVPSLYQQNAGAASRQHKYQKHNCGAVGGGGGGAGGTDGWRSTSKLVSSSNRSMPRLSASSGPGSGGGSSGRLGSSSVQLNKSLTRLNTSHHGLTTRSITALTTPSQQPPRPLSTHFTTSTAVSPLLHHQQQPLAGFNGCCVTIDASGPYAVMPVTSFPPKPAASTARLTILPASGQPTPSTSNGNPLATLGIPVNSHGYAAPCATAAGSGNMRYSSQVSGAPGSSSGSSKLGHLPHTIQTVASGPQRLSHVLTNMSSSQYANSSDGVSPDVRHHLPSASSPLSSVLSYPSCNSNATANGSAVVHTSDRGAGDMLHQVARVVAEAGTQHIDRASPNKRKSSSAGTLRDSCESTATEGMQCITATATTSTVVTTTANTTPLTTSSSGAVTSTSSGSVCDSAGSLTNNAHHHNNNNNVDTNKTSGTNSAVAASLSHSNKQCRKQCKNNSNNQVNDALSEVEGQRHPVQGGAVLRSGGVGSSAEPQRVSVFEPFAMKDTVQHFCEKHREKIKAFMQKVFVKLPLPVKCLIEERKRRKYAKLFFGCQGKGEHCLYNTQLFCIKVRQPRVWMHLMFLALQARSPSALSSRETQVSSLRHCWDTINGDTTVTFLTLVTAAFPSAKDTDALMQDLRTNRFFDVFEYNGLEQQWGCFLCNHPDKARGFVQEDTPVIEGQLKEKKSKWKLFRKWRTRYFTLSGAHLSYRGEHEDRAEEKVDIDVQRIRSVKVSKAGRHIPKAFEIFTDNKSFVLKAKDSSNAEEWVRCLSIVVAQQHVKEKTSHSGQLYSSNSMPLHHHHSAPSHRTNRTQTGACSSSSSVWPAVYSNNSRVSSNTSLPRSLLCSPRGTAPLQPQYTATPLPHVAAGGAAAAAAAPTLPALPPTLLSQHQAAVVQHSVGGTATAQRHLGQLSRAAGVAGTTSSLPHELRLIRSDV